MDKLRLVSRKIRTHPELLIFGPFSYKFFVPIRVDLTNFLVPNKKTDMVHFRINVSFP